MIPIEDTTSLSQLFHLNSQPWGNESGIEFVNHPDCGFQVDSDLRVTLPDPSSTKLRDLISARKSVREFREEVLPLETLSTLLAATYGVVNERESGMDFERRSVPSGGATYPLEIFLFLRRVAGLEDGLYHYDAMSNVLERISMRNMESEICETFITYPFMKNANVVLCHVAVFARSQKKYGARGYRYILLEAGHSAQNLCLAATELELGSLCMGGFWDNKLNKLLSLDGSNAAAVYSVAVGFK